MSDLAEHYYAYIDSVRFSSPLQFIRFDLARLDYRPSRDRDFADIDLEILEVEIQHPRKAPRIRAWEDLRAGTWLKLQLRPTPRREGPVVGRYYSYRGPIQGAETPEPQYVEPRIEGRVPSEFKALMTTTPSAEDMGIVTDLMNAICPQVVNVANVGQAACVAVLGISRRATAYLDVGWPVGSNSTTSPSSFVFCTSDAPTVFLSHWDMDHWFGARKDPGLLKSNWVVPTLNGLGKSAFELARALKSYGHLFVWKGPPGHVVVNRWGSVAIGRATGVRRNHSGLVTQVTDLCGSIILYPGDCDYRKLPAFTSPPTVLIATHHGGDHPGSTPPSPHPGCRLGWCAISCGNGNTYGHPKPAAVSKLRNAGWRHILTTRNGSIGVAPLLWPTSCNQPCSCRPHQHF